MQPLLQIEDLSIIFPPVKESPAVVKKISFDLFSGQITAIVGESGSGKSVTALSILQLLPSQAQVNGRIFFNNINGRFDLLTLSSKEINDFRGNQITMVFQEPMTSLNPVHTCGYQVMDVLKRHRKLSWKEAKARAIEMFTLVELPEPAAIFDRYPHELSGGQRQRVMIAMAIICQPKLLIADEPTTALDVRVQHTILRLLRKLQGVYDLSVLLITHDLGIVSDIADRVLVMYKGELVEQGETQQLLRNPMHPYTRALLACRPSAHTRGEILPVVADFLDTNAEREVSYKKEKEIHLPLAVNNEVALSVRDLSVYFPLKKNFLGTPVAFLKAVDDVSFDINKGETVGLVGESGCGKTTLGKAILKLVPLITGQILLSGKDISKLNKAELKIYRKTLQVVFQDPYSSLNPRMAIGEAILEPMKIHQLYGTGKSRREKVIELLERVGLNSDHYKLYPHQFSGGQRQRVCIARALSLEPSILVFDEAVSALDVSVQAQILNLINELKSVYGFTSLFITHDLGVVHYISDRIMVMNKGRIVESGDADSIYYHPQNEYTQKLIEAIPGKSLAQ